MNILKDENKELQNIFLQSLLDDETNLTVFLISGIKLEGIITSFDDEALLLTRDSKSQLIYKNAIATIVPIGFDGNHK
jgi:host factor-I protein